MLKRRTLSRWPRQQNAHQMITDFLNHSYLFTIIFRQLFLSYSVVCKRLSKSSLWGCLYKRMYYKCSHVCQPDAGVRSSISHLATRSDTRWTPWCSCLPVSNACFFFGGATSTVLILCIENHYASLWLLLFAGFFSLILIRRRKNRAPVDYIHYIVMISCFKYMWRWYFTHMKAASSPLASILMGSNSIQRS